MSTCVCHCEVLSEMPLTHPLAITSLTRQDGQLQRSRDGSVGFVCVASGPVLAHGKLRLLFFTGALVKLCHAVDSLYLSVFPPEFILPVTHFDIPLPAGSFSTVLNTNGASSGVIAPIDGQSGSVTLSPCSRQSLRLISFKRYTRSRACPPSHP